MKGHITKQFQGFTVTSKNPLTNIEIEGINYPYFLNDPSKKEMIRNLQVNDVVEFETKQNGTVITTIKKIEVKEAGNDVITPTSNNRNDIQERILKQVCLKIGSEHKDDPISILNFAEKLFVMIKDKGYL